MLYGTKYWAIKKQHVHEKSVVEMIMLRCIHGVTKKYWILVVGSPSFWNAPHPLCID